MIGILLIYFIGKYYYELAQDYYKNRWVYAILGIVLYYVGSAIGGVIIGVADDLFSLNINWGYITLMIIALLSGGISTILGYVLLNWKWKKSKIEVKDEINDIGKSE